MHVRAGAAFGEQTERPSLPSQRGEVEGLAFENLLWGKHQFPRHSLCPELSFTDH